MHGLHAGHIFGSDDERLTFSFVRHGAFELHNAILYNDIDLGRPRLIRALN